MCDEINILGEHDDAWCEKIGTIKGWKEKKDLLDVLQ